MAESQNIEWKESWRDEYLKWICGFANAQGGKLYIGKKDNGTVTGLRDAKKLMEDIPNKIQNKLGIVADVNLLSENGLEYIEIVVSPWTFLGRHNSVPFNPKIAGVFYRAGYIESWGRGIRKICDACEALGTEEPKYYVSGSDIMVEFKALRSALIDQPKAPKHQSTDVGALEDSILLRMIEILRDEPDISQDTLGKRLGLTRRNIQKNINFLKETDRIKRIGGKRYGHWQIND